MDAHGLSSRTFSEWELQVVTQTSSFRRSIASRPSGLAIADEFRDAARSFSVGSGAKTSGRECFRAYRGFLFCDRPQQLRELGDIGGDPTRLVRRPTVAGSGGIFLARPVFDAFHRTEALKAYWFVSLIL
jgi:hypothetical protein